MYQILTQTTIFIMEVWFCHFMTRFRSHHEQSVKPICTLRVDRNERSEIDFINTANVRGLARFIHRFEMYGNLEMSVYTIDVHDGYSKYKTCNLRMCSVSDDIPSTSRHKPNDSSPIGALAFDIDNGVWYSWGEAPEAVKRVSAFELNIDEPVEADETKNITNIEQQIVEQFNAKKIECTFEAPPTRSKPLLQSISDTMSKMKWTGPSDDDDDDDDEEW